MGRTGDTSKGRGGMGAGVGEETVKDDIGEGERRKNVPKTLAIPVFHNRHCEARKSECEVCPIVSPQSRIPISPP